MTVNTVKNLYDRCCQDYDDHMQQTGHYAAQERILKQILGDIKSPILDIACGTGYLYRKLNEQYSDVFANDMSEKMSSRLEAEGTIVTHENAEILVSYEHQFNTLISCNLYYYLQKKEQALERWHRLLKDNGKLVLIEEYPFIQPKSTEMNDHTSELMKLIHPVSIDEIKAEVTERGFVYDKIVSTAIDNEHNLYGIVFKKE